MLGNLLSGFIMERLGRKRTIMIGSLLIIISSALLSFAPSYEVFSCLDVYLEEFWRLFCNSIKTQ